MGILKKIDWRTVFMVCLCFGILVEPAYAQELKPISEMLTKIGTALTGPIGQAAGLVALCATGFMFLTGRMNWMFAASVLVGLVIIYGAATINKGIATG